MTYFLRFTKNNNETVSFDHFKNEKLNGLCCFQIDCDEDDLFLELRKSAEKDCTYLKYNDGCFEVFYGQFIEKNPYGNGVIAKKGEIIIKGVMVYSENARTYKIETTYENF